jgi:hypothetical protein
VDLTRIGSKSVRNAVGLFSHDAPVGVANAFARLLAAELMTLPCATPVVQ